MVTKMGIKLIYISVIITTKWCKLRNTFKIVPWAYLVAQKKKNLPGL